MAYDALAESVALIESPSPTPIIRLSRRRRFAAMAVDVNGDVAATMFLRRGAGRVHEEIHILTLRGPNWHLLGGGAVSDGDDGCDGKGHLAERSSVPPQPRLSSSDSPGGISKRAMALGRSGAVRGDGGRPGRLPWRGRWVGYTTVHVGRHVESVQVADRTIPAPWHGHVLVARKGRSPLTIVAYDANATELGKARLPGVLG
ncbi:hypothetical protein [Tomitella cavernea]|uniref:hypothetical protein n=1 Tax=Tomitella cavernea TaxID=1387982 RepID=UPI001908E79A|nr:hypothetical protein [Tomitella cavernea]